MLDNLNLDTTAFTTSYSKLKAKWRHDKYELRQELAAANNCIAIGAGSCYADMVAVPRDYPEVVIKICSGDDAFIHYAHLCAVGVLSGKHHLKVFSETEIAPGTWLFVMERLEGRIGQHEWEMTMDRAIGYWPLPQRGKYAGICKGLRRDLSAIKTSFGEIGVSYCPDLHKGNVMYRKDGTIVLLDPVC